MVACGVNGLDALALATQCTQNCSEPDGEPNPPSDDGSTSGDAPAAHTDDGSDGDEDAATETDGSDAAASTETGDASDGGGDGEADSGTVASDAVADTGLLPGAIGCGAGIPCTAGSEECCLSSGESLSCVSTSASDPCPNGTDILCDDPSDCPGLVCCLQTDSDDNLLGTKCQSSCTKADSYELCAPGGSCAVGSCTALPVLPIPPLTTTSFYACL